MTASCVHAGPPLGYRWPGWCWHKLCCGGLRCSAGVTCILSMLAASSSVFCLLLYLQRPEHASIFALQYSLAGAACPADFTSCREPGLCVLEACSQAASTVLQRRSEVRLLLLPLNSAGLQRSKSLTMAWCAERIYVLGGMTNSRVQLASVESFDPRHALCSQASGSVVHPP